MSFVSSTYDQENRLIRVTTANGNRSEFSYDGMSRRVETREYQAGSLASTTRYLYDRLMPIAELDAPNAVTITITRGTDLSGSMQGAGGIGGILATNGNEYSYDGNVRDIISASGLNVAHYEYDPFGNKTVSSGSYSSQPYQWSSKEFHQPSGLVYYLYRFYSPQLGRWINPDPIEEAGGINLYGYVSKGPINKIDPTGLFSYPGTDIPITTNLLDVPSKLQDWISRNTIYKRHKDGYDSGHLSHCVSTCILASTNAGLGIIASQLTEMPFLSGATWGDYKANMQGLSHGLQHSMPPLNIPGLFGDAEDCVKKCQKDYCD